MYIPNKVHHFLRLPTKANGVPCSPSFPVSGALKSSAATWNNARSWAWTAGVPDFQKIEVVIENPPRGGYRIVGAVQRGKGGRAWQVVTPDYFLVDLREDVFLPILLEKGLPATGVIDAEFQWCVSGSQLRLEQVGSDSHAKYVSEDEWHGRKKARPKKPKKKYVGVRDLVVGQAYVFEEYGFVYNKRYLGRVRINGKIKTLWTVNAALDFTSPDFATRTTLHGGNSDHSLTVMTGSKAIRKAPVTRGCINRIDPSKVDVKRILEETTALFDGNGQQFAPEQAEVL